MTQEDQTYRKLKQIPWDDMNRIIDLKNYKPLIPGPVYTLGNTTIESSKYYNRELDIHSWRLALLFENGWTFEEFMLEGEKRAIIAQIEIVNNELKIHQGLIDRAKTFFPDLMVTQASINLGK